MIKKEQRNRGWGDRKEIKGNILVERERRGGNGDEGLERWREWRCLGLSPANNLKHTVICTFTLSLSLKVKREEIVPLSHSLLRKLWSVCHTASGHWDMAAAQEQTTAQCSSDVTPHVKHGELRRKFLQVHVINVQLKNRKEISSGVLRLHAQTTQPSTCNKETLSPQ